jgi:hypothetical protein
MDKLNYKGKGEHSVRELELIIEQQAEELHLLNSWQEQLNMHDVSKSVCNYCLEFVDTLPDKFGCKDCIEKYTKQTVSFFCTKTQNNEPKCKTECNFCKDMQKEYEEQKNDY